MRSPFRSLPSAFATFLVLPSALSLPNSASSSSQGVRVISGHETVLVQPWGQDGFRIRATLNQRFLNDDAHSVILDPPLDGPETSPIGTSYSTTLNSSESATLTNGYASVDVNGGRLSFYRIETNSSRALVLDEFWLDTPGFPARWYGRKDAQGGFRSQYTFAAPDNPSEKLFGTGQDLMGSIDKKNQTIDIVNFNTLNPIPTIMSNRGYLFFWNVPSLGKMELSSTRTRFLSDHTSIVDYYITIRPENDYDGLQQRYTAVTGRSPMIPDFGIGYWQSKNRYESQEEVINVTTEFSKRNIPVSMFVIDYFSWTYQGDWALNASYFPNPAQMTAQIRNLTGAEVMASVWPSIEDESSNWDQIESLGLAAPTGNNPHDIAGYFGDVYIHIIDSTNPEARDFLWECLDRNYYQNGIRHFWLDENEGGQVGTDVYPWTDYALGPGDQYAMLFPFFHQMAISEGQLNANGSDGVSALSLSRSSWAGSQRFASTAWSGDIVSTWDSMKEMIPAGQSMALSGQGWWNVDIGGYRSDGGSNSGNVSDPEYQELFVRWLQWGTFLPIMRSHGSRTCLPSAQEGLLDCPNEPWSYGPENEPIIVKYINLRYELQPYIKALFQKLSETGRTMMRPLFMDFSRSDPYTLSATEDLKGQYMFGPRLLVSPVTTYKATNATVYLPKLGSSAPDTKWTYWWTNETFEGGNWVTVSANKSSIPLFRLGSGADILSGNIWNAAHVPLRRGKFGLNYN